MSAMWRLMRTTALAMSLSGGLVGCGDGEAAGEKAGGAPPAVKVEVAEVREGTLQAQRTFLGYVSPLSMTTLAAAVAGTVAEVAVRPGDVVEEGAVLVRLDRDLIEPRLRAARAALKQAESEAKLSRRELGRVEKLAEPVVTAAERERFESTAEVQRSRVQAAQAEVARLRAELERHTVTAPFAGTVRSRSVEPGMWVNPGQTMVGLVSTGALQVEVDVEMGLVAHIEPGGKATLLSRPPVEAVVRGVVPALDETTRTMKVRLEPSGDAAKLLPGMPVDVRFDFKGGSGLLVSRDALVRGPGGVRVVRAVDGKAQPLEVKVTATAKSEALVEGEGLAVGDRVLVRGNERIRPGQPIEIMDAAR